MIFNLFSYNIHTLQVNNSVHVSNTRAQYGTVAYKPLWNHLKWYVFIPKLKYIYAKSTDTLRNEHIPSN